MNIHPAKLEVLISNQDEIIEHVVCECRKKLENQPNSYLCKLSTMPCAASSPLAADGPSAATITPERKPPSTKGGSYLSTISGATSSPLAADRSSAAVVTPERKPPSGKRGNYSDSTVRTLDFFAYAKKQRPAVPENPKQHVRTDSLAPKPLPDSPFLCPSKPELTSILSFKTACRHRVDPSTTTHVSLRY